MVTASALSFGSEDERSQVFRQTVELARNARTRMDSVTMDQVEYSESGEDLVARYGGTEKVYGRSFACKIICTSDSIVVIDYDSQDFEAFQRAKTILDAVEVL